MVKPTDAQEDALKQLQDATDKAVSLMQAACPEDDAAHPDRPAGGDGEAPAGDDRGGQHGQARARRVLCVALATSRRRVSTASGRSWHRTADLSSSYFRQRSRSLAVEVRHLWWRVTAAGNCLRRHRALDARELIVRQRDGERADTVGELLAPARADQRNDIRPARQHQANASCAMLTPFSRAMASSASTRTRLRARLSP